MNQSTPSGRCGAPWASRRRVAGRIPTPSSATIARGPAPGADQPIAN